MEAKLKSGHFSLFLEILCEGEKEPQLYTAPYSLPGHSSVPQTKYKHNSLSTLRTKPAEKSKVALPLAVCSPNSDGWYKLPLSSDPFSSSLPSSLAGRQPSHSASSSVGYLSRGLPSKMTELYIKR